MKKVICYRISWTPTTLLLFPPFFDELRGTFKASGENEEGIELFPLLISEDNPAVGKGKELRKDIDVPFFSTLSLC